MIPAGEGILARGLSPPRIWENRAGRSVKGGEEGDDARPGAVCGVLAV